MHLSRDSIIGFVILALIVAGVAWYLATRPTVQPASTVTSVATQTSQPVHIDQHADLYDVDAVYPSSTALAGLSNGSDVNAVALMKQWELDTIGTFESNFTNLPADLLAHIKSSNIKGALKIEYKTYTGAQTVSYVYTTFEDTLGAHPNTDYKTFTFDTKTGTNLSLASLFTPGTDYLGFLSTYAKANLPAMIAAHEQVDVSQIDMDMLNAGTVADVTSFQDFYLDSKNLVLLFPPYAVGPYVLGSVELDIPLASVPGLKPEYK